jgi:hypothetical protein
MHGLTLFTLIVAPQYVHTFVPPSSRIPLRPTKNSLTIQVLFDSFDCSTEKIDTLKDAYNGDNNSSVIEDFRLKPFGQKRLEETRTPELSVQRILRFAIPAIGIWVCSPLLSVIDTSAVGLISGTVQQAALNPAVAVTDYTARCMVGWIMFPRRVHATLAIPLYHLCLTMLDANFS